MGKSLRKDAKYPNEIDKNTFAKEKKQKSRQLDHQLSYEKQQGKQKLHGNFPQHNWPMAHNNKKGQKI